MQVVCVNKGNYLGRGKEYVEILYDMIRRNTSKDFEFICFTDDTEPYNEKIIKRPLPENLKGWWAKLYLFSEEANLEGQIFYFDLDTLITANIDEIFDYKGEFCILRDFLRPNGYGSGLMSWKEGYGTHIWKSFKEAEYPEVEGGDQAWVEKQVPKADLWQDIYIGVYSYKVHASEWPPDDTKIVCFHGFPRPHDLNDSWVNFIWQIGGAQHFEECTHKDFSNVADGKRLENIRQNVKLDLPWYIPIPPKSNHKTVCIVGGSPSLKKNLGKLREKIRLGAKVMSVNGTLKYLTSIGIKPDFHAQFDARPECKSFLENCPEGIKYFIGSMSDPIIFEGMDKKDVEVWHGGSDLEETMKILEPYQYKPIIIHGGGTTIGLRAWSLLYYKGYYKYEIFGMDSCFNDTEHHAYEQKVNDKDGWMWVHFNKEKYRCAPWMYRQAVGFQTMWKHYIDQGCKINVHGEGLIPDMCRVLNERNNML